MSGQGGRMSAGKCVTLAEVGAQWHNGSFPIPLLPCFLFDTLSFSITTTQMKPGHAPSEWRNRQLPLVALQGLTYKEIWGNSSNPKTAPVSHTPPLLPLFHCVSWSDDECSMGGQWLWIGTKDRPITSVSSCEDLWGNMEFNHWSFHNPSFSLKSRP